MASTKRCGNCELLVRSSTPGLATYGKCPHRSGWVRAHDEPCEWHQGEPQGPVVKVAMALNLVAATFGAAFAVWMSVRHGNTLTNVLLAAAGVTVLAFGWFVWKRGLF